MAEQTRTPPWASVEAWAIESDRNLRIFLIGLWSVFGVFAISVILLVAHLVLPPSVRPL